jgi:amino acid adenylation domain-containing protein
MGSSNMLAGFRLSPHQERIWREQQNRSETPFRAQCVLRIDGPRSASAIEKALQMLVARHEILRTSFFRPAGVTTPFQVISEDVGFLLAQEDWSGTPVTGQNPGLKEKAAEEMRRHVDWEKTPALRGLLVKLPEQKHALVLTLSSLHCDARSLRNLVADFGRCLAAVENNTTLQDEPLRYVQFSEWQNELLESEDENARKAAAYWDKLGVATALLPFERKAGESFAPARVSIPLPEGTIGSIRQSAASTPPPTFLLACWYALLWRVSGRQNATVGVLSEGREYEELADALGLFARRIPVPCFFDGNFRFFEVLQQLQKSLAEATEWQDYFPGAKHDLGLAFDYETWPEVENIAGLRIQVEEVYSCLDRFRLKLVAREMGGRGLRAELHYDPACFEQETVARLARQFATLLASALENPAARVRELALLTAGEEQELLQRWNQTAADYPALCLQQWFEAQAARTPSALAVRCGDAALSYGELNARANQLAHALRKAGVGPDTLVGLLLDRSLELITGLLAILKAGGAYVPLNPGTPAARLEQQLSGAQAVVTVAALRTQLPSFAGKVLDLDSDRDALAGESTANPACTTTPENLAYVLYTSGSTGVPKGVAVRHRNLVNYTQFMVRKLGLEKEPGLQLATVSTLAADLGNTCIFPALVAGGCLHVIPYEISTDAARLAEYVARYPIDVLKIVPSHLSALLAAAEGRPILPRRNLITGGEALKPELVERIRQAAASCQLLNHYGPTETTIGSLTFEVEEYAQVCRWAEWTVPIGRPIANTRVYVLDEDRRPVPVGTPGELYIGGDGVAAGYWQQPQLTAERFVPEPFVTEATAKMYRTGDRVRQLPNGAIEFLGRADDQVKIRGFRIELGEIEAVLGEHSGVRQAVVLAREQENGEQRLVAYVVARTRPAPNRETLSQHLLRKLPDYMVPAAWVVLEELPLNANGKVDRQALPAPEEARGLEYVAPRTAVEEVVAGMWAEVLKLERVGVHEDLFRLGAHSLLATQVVSRVRRVFRVEIPLRAMFETPTVAGLAEKIEQARRAGGDDNAPPLVPVAREGSLPLSFAQQRLWFFSQLEPESPFYNVPRTVRLRGKLDVKALESSLNQIVARHEVLRTTFDSVGDEPVQVISPELHLAISIFDLRQLPEEEREDEAQRLAREEAQRPFDLARGPLLRPALLRLADDHHVLLLTMHHIVSDGWSANLLFQELESLYNAAVAGKPSPLAPLPVQYADYAVWQRKWLQGEVLEQQMNYWRRQLQGVPAQMKIPTDRPRPATQSFRGDKLTVNYPRETAEQLKSLSRQNGATLFMTLLSAFEVLLAYSTGQRDLVVGTDLANRTRMETERMIGFFINLLPLRVDLSDNPSFDEIVARVRETALGAYAHQEVPFEKLVEELRLERSPAYNPLVQVLFVMQNVPRRQLSLSGLESGSFGSRLERSKFDMAVFMVESDAGFTSHWVYATDLFEEATIARWGERYRQVLAAVIAQPEAKLEQLLEILRRADQQQRATEEKNFETASRQRLKQVKRKALTEA